MTLLIDLFGAGLKAFPSFLKLVAWITPSVWTLYIRLVGPSNVSYFHTPDIPPNKDIYGRGLPTYFFSYTKFRARVRIETARRIRIHSIKVYCFNNNLEEKWSELESVSLKLQFEDRFMHDSLREFENANSRPKFDERVELDNGNEACGIEIDKDGSSDIVIARVGQFDKSLPAPPTWRVVKDTEYCDVLIIFDVNLMQIAMLCSLPVYHTDEMCMPIILESKVFSECSKSSIIAWADKARAATLHKGGKDRVRLIVNAWILAWVGGAIIAVCIGALLAALVYFYSLKPDIGWTESL
jgi:hypothetical protein